MDNMFITAAKEQATKDYNELYKAVKGMAFVDAYNKFNGYNLEMSPTTVCDKLIGFDIRFDLKYRSIRTTIFCTDNLCELWETVRTEISLGDNIAVVIDFEPDIQ